MSIRRPTESRPLMGRLIVPGRKTGVFFAIWVDSFDRALRIRYDEFAGWSSLVARRAHNPEVVGSNPTPATTPLFRAKRKPGPFSLIACARKAGLSSFLRVPQNPRDSGPEIVGSNPPPRNHAIIRGQANAWLFVLLQWRLGDAPTIGDDIPPGGK